MKRRNFIHMTLSASVAGGLPGLVCAAPARRTSGAPQESDRSENEGHDPTLPPDVRGKTFTRLDEAIQTLPAFNNHLHYDGQEESLGWFFSPTPGISRSKARTRSVVEGLSRLLDLPRERITPEHEKEVRERYQAFCQRHSLRDFYHKLCDLTHTSHIGFITHTEAPENKTLPSERLKLVMHVDHYLFPLDNTQVRGVQPVADFRLSLCTEDLKREYGVAGGKPDSFDAYLKFVHQSLARHRANPAVIGGKWGFSYWRSFDIRPVEPDEARRIYEAGDTSAAAYKRLQDYLAFYVLKTCAELQFPLQIHTGLGADPGLILADSDPALLDRLFARPELDKARIVCLHGGYPFSRTLGVMALRKNVWLDFSWLVLLLSPAQLAEYLKEWLEIAGPRKILFGIDGAGVAQIAGTWCGRRALAIALTRLVCEEQIGEDEALGQARAILHDNAMQFYGLTPRSEL